MKFLFYFFLLLGITGALFGTAGHLASLFLGPIPTDLKQYASLVEIRGDVCLVIAYLIKRDYLTHA